jgi:hypothetical protein
LGRSLLAHPVLRAVGVSTIRERTLTDNKRTRTEEPNSRGLSVCVRSLRLCPFIVVDAGVARRVGAQRQATMTMGHCNADLADFTENCQNKSPSSFCFRVIRMIAQCAFPKSSNHTGRADQSRTMELLRHTSLSHSSLPMLRHLQRQRGPSAQGLAGTLSAPASGPPLRFGALGRWDPGGGEYLGAPSWRHGRRPGRSAIEPRRSVPN